MSALSEPECLSPTTPQRRILASSLFEALEPSLAEELASISLSRSYRAGELIFEAGEAAEGFHLISSGRVKVCQLGTDGREQILHLFGPGEPFGEAAAFLNRPYPARAQAIDDSLTLFFPRRALKELLASAPELALSLMGLMAQRLMRLAALVGTVALKEIPARLADFILQVAGEEDRAELKLSKKQLACLIGTSPESFSRALARLKSAGLIEEAKPHLKILDRRGLERVAEGLAWEDK